jgi:hypothetical protein
MRGQYIGSTDSWLISNEDRFLWLSRGDVKRKLKVNRQNTRYGIANKILCNQDITNRNRNSKCRLSQQFDKTIDIISGCPIFTKEQYVKKHDSVLNNTLKYARKWG